MMDVGDHDHPAPPVLPALSARPGALPDVAWLNLKLPAYVPSILLTAALLVAVTMAYRLWQETHEDDEPVSDHEILSEFEEAHAAGELDEAELLRVRELLARPRDPGAGETERGVPRTAREAPPGANGGASAPDDPGTPSERA
jgi:hypothetical protein